MASSDMDQKQAEIFLTSQTRKQEGSITDDQSKVFQRCWKLHRCRIHDSLVEACVWNNQLQDISWRIDIKSQSRNVKQLNASTAIVEVQLKNCDLYQQGVEIIRFEVDDTGLAKMHRELLEIEEQIKKNADLASALPHC